MAGGVLALLSFCSGAATRQKKQKNKYEHRHSFSQPKNHQFRDIWNTCMYLLPCHCVTIGSPLCHLHNKAQCSLSSCVLYVMSPEHTVFYNLSLGSVCKTPCVYYVNKTQSIYYVSLCTEHCVHYIVCPWLLSAVSCQLNTQPNIGCHADLADTPQSSQLQFYRVTVMYTTL